MKICEFTRHELEAVNDPNETGSIVIIPTPMQTAMLVLVRALETVNRAGLDGKELTKINLVQQFDPAKHPDDQTIEVHADVKHRLASKEPPHV